MPDIVRFVEYSKEQVPRDLRDHVTAKPCLGGDP
jgi:hypothetical protein